MQVERGRERERERENASACIRRHQASALPPWCDPRTSARGPAVFSVITYPLFTSFCPRQPLVRTQRPRWWCKSKQVETGVDSAWLQLLKLKYDELLSSFAFKFKLRPYTTGHLELNMTEFGTFFVGNLSHGAQLATVVNVGGNSPAQGGAVLVETRVEWGPGRKPVPAYTRGSVPLSQGPGRKPGAS